MQLDDYFDFDDQAIRIRGTRVGIETVLFDFLSGASPEEIAVRYRSLSLEQVYAAVTYYLRHQGRMKAYLAACQIHAEKQWSEQSDGQDGLVQRLRLLKTSRVATPEG